MSSKCTNDGQMILDVTFELGTNLDMAQVLVQNRVSVAEAKLPEDVKRQGVTTKKKSPSILLCVNLISDKRTRDGELLLRPALPEQLRHAQRQGRPGPHQGRRRRDLPRPARLQHARLARSGQARGPRHDGRRRDQGHPRAERPGGGRPARPAARPRRPTGPLSATHQHAGPARRARSSSTNIIVKTGADGDVVKLRDVVRETHVTPTAEHRERHRAGRQELRRQQLPRRRSVGHAGRVPVARLQRPGNGRRHQGQDGGAEGDVSPRASTTGSSTTRRCSSTNRSTQVYPHADRGLHPGLHRRAGVPAELAGHDHPDDRRARCR